jgi:OTU domain-containing protein 6
MLKKELDRQKEMGGMGPSARDLEIDRLAELYLDPNNLDIVEVPADGHCLFRAIAELLNTEVTIDDEDDDYEHILMDYRILREKCADELALHEDTLGPFCEYEDSFQSYVERIRTSADAWGGHVELRALSQALNRPIIVYSATAPPLVMKGLSFEGEEENPLSEFKKPLRVTYHRHYYALGEHYNYVAVRRNNNSSNE